ncbi:hypothetical protein ACFWSF_39105 [Streptomyces sp. NPDC058611]|uniref:hypothetical protein n=1 Tax=unclassified Streptomyces TaxID=2593676 RepID=UPI0036512402
MPRFVPLHCAPCPSCVFHARQLVEAGRLAWQADWECGTCEFGAPDVCNRDHGTGVPPAYVREAVVAREGTVLLRVDGARAAALKVLRDALGLTLPELAAVVRDGYRATPVEARHLTDALHGAGFRSVPTWRDHLRASKGEEPRGVAWTANALAPSS